MPIDVGPKRKIFRGGVEENTPVQSEHTMVTAGLKPGMLVVRNGNNFALPAASFGGYVYIANAPMHRDPISYVYAANETVFAYRPRSRDVFLMRAAAGLTVAADAPLAVDAAGRVVAAGSNPVIGYSVFAVNAAAVDTLIDVRFK